VNGFGRCLAFVLGDASGEVPETHDREPLVFWQQWLAERQLGLVPVAEAERFGWAGNWLGLVRDAAGEQQAVVMFGLPSGPVLDPAGVLDRDTTRTIEEGFVVAPLGALFFRGSQSGQASLDGRVEAVLVAPEACVPLTRLSRVRALRGEGLEGDRYAARRGTFGGDGGNGYDLTLIEAEALDELARGGIAFGWEEARRNVVTRGIDLNALVGRQFRVGEVECIGRRLAEPCAHLQRLTRPGVLRGLVHRGGLRADILSDGVIAEGDSVSAQA